MAAKQRGIPPLSRLSESEARSIESMFRLYDYNATGRIPQHLTFKLCKALGFDFSVHTLPVNATLKELLLFLDLRVVDPEPALFSQMHSFTHLVAKKINLTKNRKIKNDQEGSEGGDNGGGGDSDVANASTPRQGQDGDDDENPNFVLQRLL